METIRLPFNEANELTSALGSLAEIMGSAAYVAQTAADANGRCASAGFHDLENAALNDYYAACRTAMYLSEYAARVASELIERIETRRG